MLLYRGYMPPEYVERGIISPMFDIFSLGVIIMEIITGHRDYPYDIRKSSRSFIEHVREIILSI
jgi:serine/threonine protein kinase